MKKGFYIAALVVAIAACAAEFWLQHLANDAHSSQVAEVFSHGGKELDHYGKVPDFALTNVDKQRVRLSDLKGKVWLADFVYTTCPSSCPMLSSNLEGLQKDVLALNGTRMVSFSVDPEHDTPEVLSAYAKRFKAQPGWYFLTGDKEQIGKIAREGFLLGFAALPNGKDITHSTKIALVDKNGEVRHFYDGVGKSDREKILSDIKALLRETP